MDLLHPQIIEQTDDYTVIFKPPKMHSVPLKGNNGDTLVEWFVKKKLTDKYLPDSGLMHRLDFDTHGLVLFAKNKKSYDFFKDIQEKGEFKKEYSAVCLESSFYPRIVMSYFRPYGPGRKLVYPVTEAKKHHKIAKDKGGFYRTEIINVEECGQGNVFTVRIKRGFRHQIRCHLSWIGCPILNDPLYAPAVNLTHGNSDSDCKFMALRAQALFFTDPSTHEKRECKIDPIMV